MSACPVFLPNHNVSHWRWIPLLTPAVKENSCEVDDHLLNSRITVVVKAALVVLVSTMLLAIAFPTAISTMPLSFLLFGGAPLLDWWIAERATNLKAVNEYLGKAPPSKSATFLIQHNLKAAQLLIRKKGDINKVNECRARLLEFCSNLDVFKLLIDHGADIKGLGFCGFSYFHSVVKDENPAYLEYVLKKGKAAPCDFDATEQIQFWQMLGSIRAGHLLIKHGFNVNIKDEDGYTPLLRVVQAASDVFYVARLNIQVLISTLLACGADPLITIDDEGIQKNAMDIANPKIRGILKRAIEVQS